jgi:CheY-like chemotaxis protein/signal transduction histidine kinase/class 3 adenylate cyclase
VKPERRSGGSLGDRLVDFWDELKRRHVVRVGLVYLAVGLAVIGSANDIFTALHLPAWTATFTVVLVILGFPLALGLAWAFDVTPQGVMRTPEDAEAGAPGASRVPVRRVFPSSPARSGARTPAPPEPEEVPAEAPAEPLGPGRARRAAMATLRHELRTPLNAVLGYSEMLLEDGAAEDGEHAGLEAVRTAGKRILAQIDEIVRPGGLPEELSEEAAARIRSRIRAELQEHTRDLADRARALLDATRARSGQSAPDLDRIADAAVHLHSLVTRVEQADAAPAGAADPAHDRTREATERLMARIGTGRSAPAPPRYGQILVVDDNAMNRDLLARQLTRQGYAVSTAANGREALEALRSRDFDLILLDVLMPEMDGIEVLDRMRREEALAETPVIMISALDEMDGVVRCIEKGALDYLPKPFDPVLLTARIGTTLELHRLRVQERRASEALDAQLAWSERLLRGLLPASLAERVRGGGTEVAESWDEATVVAVELSGIATLASRAGAERAVSFFGEAVDVLERLAREAAAETSWLGGRRMVALVAPAAAERHVEVAADLALRMAGEVAAIAVEGEAPRVAFGMHTGPVVAGLAGSERLVHGVWGEAVELGEALGRSAAAGEIRVSSAVYSRLYGTFDLESGDVVEIAGRSRIPSYRLRGRRETPVSA